MFRFYRICGILRQVSDSGGGGNTGNLDIQNIGEGSGADENLQIINRGTRGDTDDDTTVEIPEGESDANRGRDAEDHSDDTTVGDGNEDDEESTDESEDEDLAGEEVDEDLTDDEEETSVQEEKPKPDEKKTLFQRLKDIDKDIYKKVPELRNVLGQYTQYAEVFESPQAAQEALVALDNYSEMEVDLQEGEISPLLKLFQERDPSIVGRLAKNFLPQLEKVNYEAYTKAIKPVLVNLMHSIHDAGLMHNDKNLVNTAKMLSFYLTKSYDIPRKDEGPTPEEQRLQKERDEAVNQSFEKELGKVRTTCTTRLEAMIEQIVDPKKALPEKTRQAIIEDAFKAINEEAKKDQAYLNRMNRLAKTARLTRFSRNEDASMLNAFLARVKPLVGPTTRKVMEEWNVTQENTDTGKVRNQNSGNRGQQNQSQNKNLNQQNKNQNQNQNSNQNRRVPANTGTHEARGGNGRGYDASSVDWTKTTDKNIMDGFYYAKKDGRKVRFRKQY